jgi:uracil-DNA glycosylase family 4
VQMAHSGRQADYAAFKADLLGELDSRTTEIAVAAVAGGARVYPTVHVRTRAHRALRILRADFYGPTKHVPIWLEGELNDRMFAVWFMDDGYLRIREGRQPRAEIATCAFTDADIAVLLKALARLGISGKALGGRIHFGVQATRRLSEVIAGLVPPSMRYKLHPEIEASVPFDPARWERGPAETFYAEAEIEDITNEYRADKTFFCIDVEDTHNFVTAGGVVHNCRPPGNRDPQPDEIEACESHLFRQIELIEPTIVATLGNFATKLLSGRPLGITRVHGQEQPTTLGGREVVLYPLYHPAAALYTPAMLKVLESDFARIPELLGRALVPEPELALVAEPPPPAQQLGLF